MKRTYLLEEFGVQKHNLLLQNGLEVIFIEKPFAPIFAKMVIGAGSICNESDNGLAHFTEHMLVGASKRYPKKELLASVVNDVGGYTNARTALTWMAVECEVALPEHLPRMKEHFTQALGEIYITPELLLKEKGVITAETKEKESNPEYHAGRFLRKKLTGETSWAHSNLGTLEQMQALTEEEVQHFFSAHLRVENMVLVICGGCTIAEVMRTFGELPIYSGGKRATLPSDPAVLPPNQRLFFEQQIEQSNVGLFFRGPIIGTREGAVLSFVLSAAHSGIDSRFFTKLRNERGLTYNVELGNPQFNTLRYTGTFVGVVPYQIDEAIQTILQCYEELLRDGMSSEQLRQRIDRRYFAQRRGKETVSDWVNEFDDCLYQDPPDVFGDFPDCFNFWETITPEEVKVVLHKYITLDNFHLYINGKEPSKKYF